MLIVCLVMRAFQREIEAFDEVFWHLRMTSDHILIEYDDGTYNEQQRSA